MYRMVFGQSRQEDLVSHLLTQLPQSEVESFVAQLRIDLSPQKRAEPSAEAEVLRPASNLAPDE